MSWVSSQLDALGLTGVRRLRAAAWPHSSSLESFYEQYRKLMPILRPLPTAADSGSVQSREAAQCLLTILKVSPAEYRLGSTRVFLSSNAARQLRNRVRHVGLVLARRAMRHGFPFLQTPGSAYKAGHFLDP